jgi:hypothetical protein
VKTIQPQGEDSAAALVLERMSTHDEKATTVLRRACNKKPFLSTASIVGGGRGVAVHVYFFEQQKLKPGDHVSGSSAESRRSSYGSQRVQGPHRGTKIMVGPSVMTDESSMRSRTGSFRCRHAVAVQVEFGSEL